MGAVRAAVASGNFRLTDHFRMRMDQRGLFLADIEAVLDEPSKTWSDGLDDYGRERWFVVGETTDRLILELLVAIEVTDDGPSVFVTLYWQD